jgi:hypothetical protein
VSLLKAIEIADMVNLVRQVTYHRWTWAQLLTVKELRFSEP